MYYLQSRYYDPSVGRFVNADSPDYVAIQGGNLYAYCANCPTKNADYAGFCYTPSYEADEAYGNQINNVRNSEKSDWISNLVDKFVPSIYTPDIVSKDIVKPINFLGISISLTASIAWQSNANALIGILVGGKAVEVTAFLGLSRYVSFALSFGMDWKETYIKLGLAFAYNKTGKCGAIIFRIGISHITIMAVATLCAAFPVLGAFVKTAIVAMKSSLAVVTALIVSMFPKVIEMLM